MPWVKALHQVLLSLLRATDDAVRRAAAEGLALLATKMGTVFQVNLQVYPFFVSVGWTINVVSEFVINRASSRLLSPPLRSPLPSPPLPFRPGPDTSR